MKPRREGTHPNLSAHQLPGPDTETKLAALQSIDPRLRLLLLESARVGWPKGFTNDLYLHDRDTLANYPGQDLIWVLRENGTHLYPTQCTTSAEAAYYRRVIEYWSGDHKLNAATKNEERAKFFLLTETDLIPITWKTACDALKVAPPEENRHLRFE